MTIYQARRWIIIASLGVAAAAFSFFIIAPVFGYPLRSSQSQTILQIVFPVFFGYLGAATQFVFKTSPSSGDTVTTRPLMELLVKGPIVLFCLMVTITIVAFGYSNRLNAQPGEGMTVETLSATVTAALGLLTVTTKRYRILSVFC